MIRLGDEHRRALGCGISGSHRTGKTTVAEVLAKTAGCPLILSSSSAIAADMGFKMDGSEPMERRQAFQDRVLDTYCEAWETESKNGMFVCDRTPLDMAAYVISDWHLGRATPETDAWVSDYVQRCMDATGRYFFAVSLIQPGIKFEARADKPPPNALYQEIMNTTLMGLGGDMRVRSHFLVVPRRMLAVEDRHRYIGEWFFERMKGYSEHLQENLPRAA